MRPQSWQIEPGFLDPTPRSTYFPPFFFFYFSVRINCNLCVEIEGGMAADSSQTSQNIFSRNFRGTEIVHRSFSPNTIFATPETGKTCSDTCFSSRGANEWQWHRPTKFCGVQRHIRPGEGSRDGNLSRLIPETFCFFAPAEKVAQI